MIYGKSCYPFVIRLSSILHTLFDRGIPTIGNELSLQAASRSRISSLQLDSKSVI